MIEALRQFAWADVLDVAIVACGIYFAITWLRRSRAALVAVGFALLAALFLVARWLDLGLTVWVLQGLFAALALVLVVLFQDELRRAFEQLAAWALGRRDDHRPRLDATEILVRSLSRLARERVGALVVVPGIQRLERHVSGGVELGGELSQALLESLFDRHSPGHDGAVIVEDRRVVRFGVQLPLSRNVEHLAETGTRHSAALGLSERSDAICLVVSEERGSVSVASDGRLEPVPNADALAARISRFFRERRALASPDPGWSRLLRERRPEKAASLALALLLWLLVTLLQVPRSAEPEGSLPPVASGEKR